MANHAVGGGLRGMPWSSMPWLIGGLQCHQSRLDGPEEWHPHHVGVQGQTQDFVPWAHIHPFICECQWERFHLRWNFHPLQGHCICKYPPWFQLWPGWNIITPLETLSPTSRDPASLNAPILHARNLAYFELLCNGDTHGVQFWSDDGTTLVTIGLKYLFLSLPVTWTSFSTPVSPNMAGLSALPGLGKEEHPLVVGSPSCSFQVVAGGMIPTVTVSSSAAEMTVGLTYNSSQGQHLLCQCGKKRCVQSDLTAAALFPK